MELASKMRWVIVVFVLLFVLILVGWGLSSVARNLLAGGGSSSVETTEFTGPGVETASVVRYVVDGPIVASSEHRRYEIEVSENVVQMTLYSDYGQKAIAEKSYRNNSESFNTFLEALDKAGATARASGTSYEDDYNEKGACPTGLRYIIEVDDSVRRWTTSCDRKDGTAGGKMTTMRGLFSKQVPDFTDLLKGTVLNRR